MRSEKSVKDKLVRELEKRGYYTILLVSTNRNGIPDVLAFKQGHTIFVEVKAPGKKPRPLQVYRMDEIRPYCDAVAVYDGSQDISTLLTTS